MKLISRLFAESVIRIIQGTAHGLKGKVSSHLLREVSSIAKDAGISEGEIWINPVGRVSFSAEIPVDIHQQIRNVIAAED